MHTRRGENEIQKYERGNTHNNRKNKIKAIKVRAKTDKDNDNKILKIQKLWEKAVRETARIDEDNNDKNRRQKYDNCKNR